LSIGAIYQVSSHDFLLFTPVVGRVYSILYKITVGYSVDEINYVNLSIER